MNEKFDLLTVFFLVVAVIIFWRLRNVLGRRTGNERPRYDPRSAQQDGAPQPGNDKVVTLPRRETAEPREAPVGEPPREAVDVEARIRGLAPGDPATAEALVSVYRADRSFDPAHFVTGAKAAYEMIVTAFAEGNRKALKPLLSPEVYEGFASAISDRESRGEQLDQSFVGIKRADIVEAELNGSIAQLTVKFVSELISATRDRAGKVITGDPKAIREVTDIWTFAREVTSRDPNWRLVATGPAH